MFIPPLAKPISINIVDMSKNSFIFIYLHSSSFLLCTFPFSFNCNTPAVLMFVVEYLVALLDQHTITEDHVLANPTIDLPWHLPRQSAQLLSIPLILSSTQLC